MDEVNDALLRISPIESTVLMGGLNEHVGTDKHTSKGVIGKQNFCIVLSDLFSDVLDVRVKRSAEFSTEYRLVVCSLRLSKPWPNGVSIRSSVIYRIKWNALKNKEVRKHFASNISSKFRQLPDVSEDIEKEWLLFRSAIISSVTESFGQKRLRVVGDSEKRTPWWNQEVKDAIRAKKNEFKTLLQARSSSDLQSRYTET